MKYFTSLLVIASLVPSFAESATPSRARPGSVSGAIMSKAVPQVMTANAITTSAHMPSIRYAPDTNNPLKEITLPDGSIGYIDAANGNRFEYDRDGNLSKLAVDPDDVIITSLGVTVGNARRACQSIYADSYQAIFDETSYECLIPIVAHNWSGIIAKGGENVVAWAPMGNMFKCSADAFENIKNMRRSSQWVVPVMVVGSTGIGAGIGAAIDSKQNKKADELANQLAANAADGMAFSKSMNVDVTNVQYAGKTYNLRNDASRKELISALGLDGQGRATSAQALIDNYHRELADCMRLNFKEMVSTYIDDMQKLGRIKISSQSNRNCELPETSTDTIYCSYDEIHATTTEWADCDEKHSSYSKDGKKLYPSNGGCYYRDEHTVKYGTKNKDGYNPFNRQSAYEDTTVSFDKHRFDTIAWYRNLNISGITDPTLAGQISALQSNLKKISMNEGKSGRVSSAEYFNDTYGGTANYFVVWGDGIHFGDVVPANANPICNLSGPASANTVEKMSQAYGALIALKNYNQEIPGAVPDMGNLNDFLSKLSATVEIQAKFNADISMDIRKEFGSDRKFMDKAVGKGTVIGASVGTVAGLGYWFAEGASVYCNAGGFDQVKLNKSYPLPTFRDYIVKHNYAQ